MTEVFAGPRSKLRKNEDLFGETKTYFYRRGGLTVEAEKVLREQVAAFYQVDRSFGS